MRGFRPIMVLVTLVFPQPRFITHLKFDWDPQSFRHEPRVRALFVWNQILEDFSVCPHASVSPISSQNPTGAGSHRGRIESAAHQHTRAVSSQQVRDGTIKKFPELIDILAWMHVMDYSDIW